MRLTWSETANASIAQLEQYFLQFSESSARDWIGKFRYSAQAASQFPRSHRIVPEVGLDHVREVLIGPYRLWFRIYDSEERIDVMVVFHGARDVPR